MAGSLWISLFPQPQGPQWGSWACYAPTGQALQSFSPGKCLYHRGTLAWVAAPTPPQVTSLVSGTWRNIHQSHYDSNLLKREGKRRYRQLCILPRLQNIKSKNGLQNNFIPCHEQGLSWPLTLLGMGHPRFLHAREISTVKNADRQQQIPITDQLNSTSSLFTTVCGCTGRLLPHTTVWFIDEAIVMKMDCS